jgi:signal transduction histidine kinase
MRERVDLVSGELTVDTAPGEGTAIVATFAERRARQAGAPAP